MCAIAGGFSFRNVAPPIDHRVVQGLSDLQHRRGPDGSGLWSSADGRVVLGHRRLAIIDTSPTAAQPMADATGRWVISFNGEIYNYRALRSELEQCGCQFLTNSDTEVLINAVGQWGEGALMKLRGMYAFALWDSLQQELWLARDPYGVKPLYVAQNKGTIWFASQARALASCAPVDTARDSAAVTGFYLWGSVPEPFSWWNGIQMFPAGHLQRFRFGADAPPAKSFARVEDAYLAHSPHPLSPEELHVLLLDSVQHHLVSDVPVGLFLSAGIDSNVIAALGVECGAQLNTVTLAFEEYIGTPDDEAPLAEASAKLLKTSHTTVRVGRQEFEGLVDDFLRAMDQPSIDGLNTYLVSYIASKQGLKVALSGLGGDELFGGYPSYRQIPTLLKWGKHVPRSIRGRGVERMLRSIMPSAYAKAAGLLARSGDIANAYLLRRALYLEGELDGLLDESWVKDGLHKLATIDSLGKTIATLTSYNASVHAQIAALESTWYMRNQLLRDSDWASMAHGLELRVPFVDMALLEKIGPAIASKKPPNKLDLAKCVSSIPAEIVRRPKTGFTTPLRHWITNRESQTARGLRGWASSVHRHSRNIGNSTPSASVHAA